MASFYATRHPMLSMMPLPPTVTCHPTTTISANAELCMTNYIHPRLFPMLLGRIHTMEATESMQDSWEMRHLQHCSVILKEIGRCETKIADLRIRVLERDLNIKLIEEIDEISDCASYDSSSDCGGEGLLELNELLEDNPQQKRHQLPEIPVNILRAIVAPMIRDRFTFDNLAATCKELRDACATMDPPPPWPEGLLRLNVALWSIAFSPNGNFLAVGGRDGSIRLFDRRKGMLPLLTAHIARVYSIVFHPDSRIMASGSGDGDVRIWDVSNLTEPPISLMTETPHVDCLAFNHDGSILASSGDGRIRLWDINSHQCLGDISDGSRVVESVSISPDGRTIAAGDWMNRVTLWDLQTRRLVATFPESTCVHSVCYSPDSKYICSASDSTNLRLWNIASQDYTSLEGHRDSIWCVAFSPDGRRIASGSDDGTMRIFDAASGRCTEICYGHDPNSSVYGVAFSPCNKFVASVGDDGCIELRRLS